MNNTQTFRALHQQDNILHLGNVWDIQSALYFEKMGYKALGTSSAAIADTLGYEDGEQMSFDELFCVVKAIKNTISIPLTVDLEAGYSRDITCIIKNITRLTSIGIVGINLEDSIVDEHKNRNIVDSFEFSKVVELIKHDLKNDVFLNIRTDSFLMGLDCSVDESIIRAQLYEQAGADGIFLPCISDESDIKKLVDCVSIPINVMAMPELPSFSRLKALGVKRVSSGSFVYSKAKGELGQCLSEIKKDQSFDSLF